MGVPQQTSALEQTSERQKRVVSGALNDRFHETVGRKGPERRISSSRGAGIFCGTLKRDEASANRYRALGGEHAAAVDALYVAANGSNSFAP